MKKSIIVIFLIIKISGFTVILSAEESESRVYPFSYYPFQIPEEYSETFKNYRTSWKRLTGFEYSGLHWNQFVVVYSNKGDKVYKRNYLQYLEAFMAEDDDEDKINVSYLKYDPGTVFIKENYSVNEGRPGKPISVTAMIKQEKPSDNNEWLFIQFNAKGELLLNGDASKMSVKRACFSCHKNIRERDYIFATFYTDSPE